MLEQIENISPGSDYKKTRNGKNFVRVKNKSSFNKSVFNDTFVYSPAAKFLSKLDWQMKEMHVFPNEKVFISFTTANFEFHITLDLSKVNYLEKINYTIIAVREHQEKKRKLLINLSIRIDKIAYTEEIKPAEFNLLETLLLRILTLDENNTLENLSEYKLNSLLDELEEGLNAEFDYINTLIFTLIHKITNTPYFLIENENRSKSPLIKIEKVIAFTGD